MALVEQLARGGLEADGADLGSLARLMLAAAVSLGRWLAP